MGTKVCVLDSQKQTFSDDNNNVHKKTYVSSIFHYNILLVFGHLPLLDPRGHRIHQVLASPRACPSRTYILMVGISFGKDVKVWSLFSMIRLIPMPVNHAEGVLYVLQPAHDNLALMAGCAVLEEPLGVQLHERKQMVFQDHLVVHIIHGGGVGRQKVKASLSQPATKPHPHHHTGLLFHTKKFN
jgi:hypothetical protein